MSGDGCGGDGGHCGHGDFGGYGSASGASWGQPPDLAVPKLACLEINGAPVIEQSHEYVLEKPSPCALGLDIPKGDLR